MSVETGVPSIRKDTVLTPDSASDALAPIWMVPLTVSPSAGAVMARSGGVVSATGLMTVT